MNPTNLPSNVLDKIIADPKVRRSLARQSHEYFFSIYLPHYLSYPTADFQRELYALTEDEATKLAVVVAFRGSGKSTIMTQSYPIWAITGQQAKKFVLLLSQTQQQARQHLINIRQELEDNQMLRDELGPFREAEDEWGNATMVIPRYGARITAASAEQSIRGIRHGAHRPDLIICDDVEDLNSVKTREGRDKTFNWLTGEIIPAGDRNTKVLIIGNLLHEDSLLMRLKRRIELGGLDGTFRAYPIVTEDSQIMWPGQYPDMEAIESFRRRIGNEIAWEREYMLRIVPDENQPIPYQWIQHYDELPSIHAEDYRYTATGVDLAISLKQSADYTAMVTVQVHGYGDDFRVYVLPHPVNERLTHMQTLERAMKVSDQYGGEQKGRLYIEDVAYQSSTIEQLQAKYYPVEGVKVAGMDKRARLMVISHLIQSGKVRFPKRGAEILIGQLTGFGVERHDDLADAFSTVMNKVVEDDKPQSDVRVSVGGRSIFADFFEHENSSGDPDRFWDNDGPITGGLYDKQF